MTTSTTPLIAQVGADAYSDPTLAAWLATGAVGICILWFVASRLLRRTALPVNGSALFASVSLALKFVLLSWYMASRGFEPKGAAHVPVELWQNAREYGAGELLADPTFAMPAILAGPAFEAFGPEPAFVAVVNCIAVGLGALVVAGALAACVGRRPALWVLVWLTWNPASVYWGLHGLRDPLIFMALCWCAAGMIRLNAARSGHGGIAAGLRSMAVSAAMLALLRPEIVVIPAACVAVAAFFLPTARPLRALVAVLVVGGALLVPVVMQDQLGMQSLDAEAIEEVAHSRLSRAANEQAGGAGATNFFDDGDEFLLQGMGDRLGTQFIGLVACPYPVVPRGGADWTVVAESGIWALALVVPFLPIARKRCSAGTLGLARACAVCALGGLAMYAPLTINAGNAFRLRYSVLPLASVGLVLVAAPASRRRYLIVDSEDARFNYRTAAPTV